jgi:surface carbohydrate biosynthesis protein
MRRVDVLFLIEHVDRELDAVTCIAETLRREKGLRVEIRNFYSDMLYCLRKYDPAVVAMPFFYFLDHHPMKDYVAAWPNARFFNMAWEQILYKMNKSVKVPKDDFSKNSVTHVCWTREYLEFLKTLNVPRENLILTGNPVMKFYDKPYRDYFASRTMLAKRYALNPADKWVLFPENYRWAFLSDGQIKSFIRQDADPLFLEAARNYCIRSLTKFFQWTAHLAETRNTTIILRPRPATARKDIIEFMNNVAPEAAQIVKVIKDESARDWILAADHVISSYSTTLIEASLARKPINVFSPEPFPEALEDDWYQYVPMIGTESELHSALTERFCAPSWQVLSEWARTKLQPAGDPLEAVAKAIYGVHSTSKNANRGATRYSDHERIWRGLWPIERARKIMQQSALYHERLHARDNRYSFTIMKHEKDVFDAVDVAQRMSRWRAVR